MFPVPPLPDFLKRQNKKGKVDQHGNLVCVGPRDLQPGDILLSMGTVNHSDWIRFLDGGSYSHASYYDGVRLIEISVKGVVQTPPAVRVHGQVYTDVYRFCEKPDRCLSAREAKAVTKALGRYMGHPLATHDLVLCSLLVVSRKVNLPGRLEDRIRTILSGGVGLLRKLILREEKEHLICSELVCRGFWEAKPPGPFDLKIFPQFPESLFRIPMLLPESSAPGSPFSFRPQKRTQVLMEEFASLYVAHKLGHRFSLGAQHIGAPGKRSAKGLNAYLANHPVADYVTPRDLEESSSLTEIGRACKTLYPKPRKAPGTRTTPKAGKVSRSGKP